MLFLGMFFSISERLALTKPFPQNPTLLIIVVLMFYLEVESRDNLSDRQTLNLLVAYLVQWNTEINAVVSLLHMIYKLSCQTYISSFLSLPQFILTTSLSSFNNVIMSSFPVPPLLCMWRLDTADISWIKIDLKFNWICWSVEERQPERI